jgi:hypothetical protein
LIQPSHIQFPLATELCQNAWLVAALGPDADKKGYFRGSLRMTGSAKDAASVGRIRLLMAIRNSLT